METDPAQPRLFPLPDMDHFCFLWERRLLSASSAICGAGFRNQVNQSGL